MKCTRWVQSVLVLVLALMLASGCPAGGGGGVDSGVTPGDASDPPDAARGGPLPLISEFLASNQAGLTDEDGATSDWIEIHNPDSAPFDLSGYHLTDSKSNPRRWAFPAGTVLDPGAYLVVFASGKNRATPGKPLHTNFSLSSGDGCAHLGGEHLALTSRSGAPLPPVWSPYPTQSADVSYGLLSPTAASASAFFAAPTPGAPNDDGAALAERVAFTPQSRTFSAGAALPVTLSVSSPRATIRYTTNRSRPIRAAGMTGTFQADADTDLCTLAAHGLLSGDLVRVTGPAPLASKGSYFVKVRDADTFQLTSVPGGRPIDLAQSGAFDIRRDAAAVSAVAVATDVISTALEHGFYSGDPVQVRTSGALPAGVSADSTYYVVVSSATTLRLSPSPTLAPIVDLTSAGSGAHTLVRLPSPIYAEPIPVTVNTRVRARAFEPGRLDGPVSGEVYFALDVDAQARTSNLPLVISHTWNAAMPNDTVVDGHVMIFAPSSSDGLARLSDPPDFVAPCTLERHGSSTAGDPKFSMALEVQDESGVDQSCSPLGMPAHSDWLLHAPYKFDRSMMHNDLIYRVSNDAGRYAVRTRLVEHIHNEQSLADTIEGAVTAPDYFGVYSFMERISRGSSRVDVDNLTLLDNTPPAIQGGYLFKVDRLDPGEIGIRPPAGQSFGGVGSSGAGADILAWVNPRENSLDPFKRVTAAQSGWLRDHLVTAWGALSGADSADPVKGYALYWDVAAAIDHHILNTATKNADAFRLSAYWHKPRFGKLTAGPLWDFDRAQGSTDGRDFDWGTWTASGGTSFFTYPWYKELFADANFWQAWIDRLEQLRQGPLATAAIAARIDEFAAQLNPGDAADTPAKRTVTRWGQSAPRTSASNTPITSGTFDGSYSGEVAWLKYWWERRLRFMDTQFTRPALASLPAGAVPAGSSVTLTSASQAVPGVKIYYTTDGKDPRAPGGQVAPGAIEYTGPIPIKGPTRLHARAFDPTPPSDPALGKVPVGSGWSAPTVVVYSL